MSSSATTLVVDASVLVDLLGRTDLADQADAALAGHIVTAPNHVDAEVLSGLVRLHRRGLADADRVAIALHRLATMPITRLAGDQDMLQAAFNLRANVAAADALYVALARRLECPLVTSDASLARAPRLGVTVVLVG
jgi:predicted nucleic acid-binding protein